MFSEELLSKKTKNKKQAVCVFLLNKEGKVLSVSRKDSSDIGLPGGKVEVGETLEEAACRELLEETGIRLFPCSLSKLYEGEDSSGYFVTTFGVRFVMPSNNDLIAEENVTVSWVNPLELCFGQFAGYNFEVISICFKILQNSGNKH